MTPEQRDYYTHLTGIMLQTRGIRFGVAEREKKKERYSLATVAFLTIYIAVWSFLTALFPDRFLEPHIRAYSLISFAASVSLLVIALFDHAVARSVLAEKMLQNAFAITQVMREMERQLARAEPALEKLEELAHRYELLVSSTGVNHSSADYRLWHFEKRESQNFLGKIILPIAKLIARSICILNSIFFQVLLVVIIIIATISIGYQAFF